MNAEIKRKLLKKNILPIKILRDFSKIKNRKSIYNGKIKNVIGKDIKIPKLNNKYEITNNKTISEFYEKLSKIKI